MAEGWHYFTSADGGAPSLTGQNGSLITLLDWIIGLPSDSADEWVKEYSGTNKAAYRAQKGNRLYFRVQDDGPTAQAAREAGVRYFETMSDVDTGTVQVPTSTQETALGQPWVWRKSNTANATARDYFGIITARCIVLLVETVAGFWQQMCFGDAASCVSSDAYNTLLLCRDGNNSQDGSTAAAGPWASTRVSTTFVTVATTQAGVSCLVWKSRAGAVDSIQGHLLDFSLGTGAANRSGDAATTVIVPAFVMQRNATGAFPAIAADRYPRLILPFTQQIVTAGGINDGDTFSIGSRNFVVFKPGGSAASRVKALEISNTDPVQP